MCEHFTKLHFMSETFASALNAVALQVLQPYIHNGQVTLVDLFSMVHPVEELTTDGNHYGPAVLLAAAKRTVDALCMPAREGAQDA